MREIAFRAWHIHELWMDLVWLIDWEHEVICFSKHNQDWLTNCEVMQYTGLHDKNGKELWEGDIYTDPNWPRKPLVVEWVDDLYDDNGSNYSGWSVAIPENGINESIYGPTKIGNIYESPELQEVR